MSCYTLSNCILGEVELDKKYITDVLMVFPQQSNPFKIALDKCDRIMGLYEAIGQSNEFVAFWLNLMSMNPTSFETINADTLDAKNDEEIFLMVCSSTKSQQKLIVHSHEKWLYHKYSAHRIINFKGASVKVFDRDEAIVELNQKPSTTINADHSVIAADHSQIHKTENKQNGKED
jgi:hypothetical protein